MLKNTSLLYFADDRPDSVFIMKNSQDKWTHERASDNFLAEEVTVCKLTKIPDK